MPAVAAYASLVSLWQVLDNLRQQQDRQQMKTLQENVHFLLGFIEQLQSRRTAETQGLFTQLAEVAFEAEDLLNSHVVDQLIHQRRVDDNDDVDLLSFCEDMDRMIQRIDSIREQLLMIKDEGFFKQHRVYARDGLPSPSPETGVVGFAEHLVRVMDELTIGEPGLQILPIVGMGGIGKTTLVKNIFDHPYIVGHFYVRLWVTITQEYNFREILLNLLVDRENEDSIDELGEQLHKKLFGRRYMIVLDDVWMIRVWDDIRRFFPNNRNGSRIMITTRLGNVATYLGTRDPYLMSFLDENKSRDLLCRVIFSQNGCPYPELEEILKSIAKTCKGLPLAIVAIGSLIAKSNMTEKYWDMITESVNSFGNLGDEEDWSKILWLSYENLPIHLKPCFLYLRNFPEDHEIEVSRLIKLWIAEGFIKQVSHKTLEETAEEYVKDLIDRNLIFIHKRTISGEIKTCGIHDLLRDLCLRESNKECFLQSPKLQHIYLTQVKDVCFLCGGHVSCTERVVNLPRLVLDYQPESQVNCLFMCDACQRMFSQTTIRRLVRVMFSAHYGVGLQPTTLRYVSVKLIPNLNFASPSMLHLLWNLQTLIIKLDRIQSLIVILPSDIWEMPQLRHIEVEDAILLEPTNGEEPVVLKNLQTLSFVQDFKCKKDMVDRIPNLKHLEVYYQSDFDWGVDYSLCNLARLYKLESLRLERAWDRKVNLPFSLKVLGLKRCRIPWKELTVIGSLPNLEVLTLYDTMEGFEWNPNDGEFLKLKALCVKSSDLERWAADHIHFPNLKRLILHSLHSLVEIPSGIGDIVTLQDIHLYHCRYSAIDSAKGIWEEQQSMGNESLQIHVTQRNGRKYQVGVSNP